jgi:hypothetical protein
MVRQTCAVVLMGSSIRVMLCMAVYVCFRVPYRAVCDVCLMLVHVTGLQQQRA